jgi:hypothetical protein
VNAAKKQDVLFRFLDRKLSRLLSALEGTCLPPPPDMEGSMTVWPDGWRLGQLDSAVFALAVMAREKLPGSQWNAYKWVNKRWPRFHLVSRVEKLVRRARARLQEETEIDRKRTWPPDRCRREAFLEWIAHLENSDLLDVIDILYNPDPELCDGESYSLPHEIVNNIAAAREAIAKSRERKQGAKRAANYRARLKARRKFHVKKA